MDKSRIASSPGAAQTRPHEDLMTHELLLAAAALRLTF